METKQGSGREPAAKADEVESLEDLAVPEDAEVRGGGAQVSDIPFTKWQDKSSP